MYEVKTGNKIINNETVHTFSREIIDCNLLEVEAGTNGHRKNLSDDAWTYIRIYNLGATSIRVRPLGPDGEMGFEVMLAGNAELRTIIKALKFILKVLKDQSGRKLY